MIKKKMLEDDHSFHHWTVNLRYKREDGIKCKKM